MERDVLDILSNHRQQLLAETPKRVESSKKDEQRKPNEGGKQEGDEVIEEEGEDGEEMKMREERLLGF